MPESSRPPHERALDRLRRIEWPRGPACLFCGTRERVYPRIEAGVLRFRYECVDCGRHHGSVRSPTPGPGKSSTRRRILPRDPGRGR